MTWKSIGVEEELSYYFLCKGREYRVSNEQEHCSGATPIHHNAKIQVSSIERLEETLERYNMFGMVIWTVFFKQNSYFISIVKMY